MIRDHSREVFEEELFRALSISHLGSSSTGEVVPLNELRAISLFTESLGRGSIEEKDKKVSFPGDESRAAFVLANS